MATPRTHPIDIPQLNLADARNKTIDVCKTLYSFTYRHPFPATVSTTLRTWPRNNNQLLSPGLRSNVQDLYDDRTQTVRQRTALMAAKHALSVAATDPAADEGKHFVYDRVLRLYTERLNAIHEVGIGRNHLWLQYMGEEAKPRAQRDTNLMFAAANTANWMADDLMHRKMDFVAEVCELLEKVNKSMADRAALELGAMYPVLTGNGGFVNGLINGNGQSWDMLKTRGPKK